MTEEFTKIPTRLAVGTSFCGLVFIALSVGLLGIWLLHQLTIWLLLDPKSAFESSRGWVTTTSVIWDVSAHVFNGLCEVLLVLIPAWNSLTLYAFEPLVYVALGTLSLVFTGSPYNGILQQQDVPFEGHVCGPEGAVDAAATWCGYASSYSRFIGGGDDGQAPNISESIYLSPSAARRLAEAIGEPVIPELDLQGITDVVQIIFGSVVMVMATFSDVFFHALYMIIEATYEVIMKLFLLLVNALGGILMAVFSTDIFSSVLSFGVALLLGA